MSELASMTAVELLRAYRDRRLSPVEVVRQALDRARLLQPRLNAFYEIHDGQALEAARASESRWRAAAPAGILDGIPTSIKDALLTKGSPTYRGSAANDAEGRTWDIDAPCVARLREQGAIILGRTTMPDFGILASGVSTKHGVTRNPWNVARNPGGSSSGAAASIASGINPIAVGTDIVGSVRLPASFCGLVGLKPSQGRVPYYVPNSPALVAGPMARTVEDAALLLNVIGAPDGRDFTALRHEDVDYTQAMLQGPPGRRVAVLRHVGFGPALDPEVAAGFETALGLLRQAGFELVSLSSPFAAGDEEPAQSFFRARYWAELSRFPPALRALSPIVHRWARSAQDRTAADLLGDMAALLRLRERTVGLLESADADFLVLPTVPVPPYAADSPAFAEDRIFDPWANTFLFNLSEQPAISVPSGLTGDGLPVGVQIVGKRFDDVGVLQVARIFEHARGPFPLAPDLPGRPSPAAGRAAINHHHP